MKRILQFILISTMCLVYSNKTQAQYFNYSPLQELNDTLYKQLFIVAPPAYNLLYDKAFHMGTFQYSDGDWNTDTSRIDDVYQNYTEIIDMNTNGAADYEHMF